MANCKECIHYEVCRALCKSEEELMPCVVFKYRSHFVELPCKVGDSVFIIDEKENIQECTVTNVNCKTQMVLGEKPWVDFIIVTVPVDESLPFPMIFTYSATKNCTLFLTKEEAEQSLKGGEKLC